MISTLKNQEYSVVYQMLQDYLFTSKFNAKYRLYDKNVKLVKKEEDKIIGFLIFKQCNYRIHDYNILSTNLYNLCVHVDYRNRKYSQELMEAYEYYCKKSNLISTTFTYQNKLMSKYGYVKVYDVHRYSISRIEFVGKVHKNISLQFQIEELLNVYNLFTKQFKCSLVRDIDYFQELVQKVQNEGKKICVYRNKNAQCEGYAIYSSNKNGVCKIDEIIYTKSSSLKNLIYFVSEGYFDVVLDVSEYELIHKVFPKAKYTKEKSCMIRVNHLSLFNKLFFTKAKSTFELNTLFSEKSYFQDYFNE